MIVYNGNATVPTPTGASSQFVAISSTTNTTPITVNTATPHGWFTGDTIEIEGADDPNTNNLLNEGGLWVITVTGASSFQLNNSVGTLAGGAHGYVYNYEVQPAFQIASPGEAASMTTLGPVLQGIINAIPWLYRLTGRRRLHQLYYGNTNGAPITGSFATWSSNTLPTGGTATLLSGSVSGSTTLTALNSLNSDILITSRNPIVENGDDLEINWSASGYSLTSAIDVQVFLYITDGTNAVVPKDSGAYLFAGASARPTPFTIHSVITGSTLASSGLTIPTSTLSIGLAGVPQSNGGSCTLLGPSQINVKQWRRN